MSDSPPLPSVVGRFFRYVQIDTQSDRSSSTTPSTAKQKDLSQLLAEELKALGVKDAEMDEHGYVYGTLEATESGEKAPPVAFLAHVDTSPDAPGWPVVPVLHREYDGTVILLPGDPKVRLDLEKSPGLGHHIGQDLITSDGTTLLGSDDKAGVALIMQLVEDLLEDPEHSRPPLRVCFTVDEEIGRGVDKLDLERLDAAVAYTVDGGPVGELDTETFNASEATIEVKGVQVHPGTAKGVMANAATILAEVLTSLPENERPETTADEEGYFSPYELVGNVAEARAKVLLRDFTEDGMTRRKRMLEEAVAFAGAKHARAEITLSFEDSYRNMKRYIEEADPRTISFAFAAAQEIGLDLVEQRIRGGTDGARLSELGLPTPNIFTGGHDYHSCFEWNTVQNLERSLEFLKALVRYWAEHG